MSGIQPKYKKESLKAPTHQLQFTIGIITETHLLPGEVNALVISKYQMKDKMGGNKHKGGVLIMAKIGTARKKFSRTRKPSKPIDTCSALLYPTGIGKSREYAIQITGIYIPPSAQTRGANQDGKQQDVKQQQKHQDVLIAPGCQATTKKGTPLNHLMVGDFNPHCWAENASMNYQEWVMEQSPWGLADPNLRHWILA